MNHFITFVFVLITIPVFSFAQTKPKIDCEKIKHEKTTNKTSFYDVKSFQDERLVVKDAELIIMDNDTDEVIITNFSTFTFDGALQVMKGKGTQIRYKIGAKVAYLK